MPRLTSSKPPSGSRPKGETYAKAPFDPRVVDLLDLRNGLPDLSKTAAVVLANVADLPSNDAKALAGFVERGGGLVVFTGDRVTAEGSASLVEAGLGVGQVVGPESSPDRPWRLDRWEPAHPLLRPFSEPEHGDIRRPAFVSITKIVPDPSARVLASVPRWATPPCWSGRSAEGSVVWFASGCDRAWGDWPRGRMFLPMVHQMVAYASGLAEGGPDPRGTGGRRAGCLASSRPRDSSGSSTPTLTSRRRPAAPPRSSPIATASGSPSPGPSPRNPRRTASRPTTGFEGDEVWPWIALTLVGILMCRTIPRQPHGGLTQTIERPLVMRKGRP